MDDIVAVALYRIWHCDFHKHKSQGSNLSPSSVPKFLAYQVLGSAGVYALSFAANKYMLRYRHCGLYLKVPIYTAAEVSLGNFSMSIQHAVPELKAA